MSNLIVSSNKNEVMGSLQALFNEYEDKKKQILVLSSQVKNKSEIINYFFKGNEISSAFASQAFDETGALAALNAEFWSKAINMTDVRECMTAKKRNEWDENIHKMKTPEFEKESVINTIMFLLGNRHNLLAEKVDGVFRRLSGNHVTNSPMGFRSRMIIESVLDKYLYTNYNQAEYIHDLRTIIAKLQKRDNHSVYQTRSDISHIARDLKDFGNWFEFDGGAFKIKLFKKGTAHLEVSDEVALELNEILASLYPQALAPTARAKTNNKKVDIELKQDLLSNKVIDKLFTISEYCDRNKSFSLSFLDIEDNSSLINELTEVLLYLGAKENDRLWSFDYQASNVLKKICRTGSLPEQKSHQFYPTPEDLAQRVVEMAEIKPSDSILEPSAGMGGIAQYLPQSQTTCIEISPVHAQVLKDKGFRTECMDFLQYETSERFDKIIMNPPFTKNQAKIHVEKALQLLKPNGILVAILPASMINKTLIENKTHRYSKVIEAAFEDTKVNVVILEIY